MNLLDFQASIDANTVALRKLTEVLTAAAGSAAPAGEAKRGPGRPPKTETATTQGVTNAGAATTAAAVAAVASTQTAVTPAANTAKTGPLVHRDLVVSFKEFAKIHGRDGVVKLLGEFGAAEFGQVKLDDLPLFKGRLEGVAQTPTDPSDVSNLLGLT